MTTDFWIEFLLSVLAGIRKNASTKNIFGFMRAAEVQLAAMIVSEPWIFGYFRDEPLLSTLLEQCDIVSTIPEIIEISPHLRMIYNHLGAATRRRQPMTVQQILKWKLLPERIAQLVDPSLAHHETYPCIMGHANDTPYVLRDREPYTRLVPIISSRDFMPEITFNMNNDILYLGYFRYLQRIQGVGSKLINYTLDRSYSGHINVSLFQAHRWAAALRIFRFQHQRPPWMIYPETDTESILIIDPSWWTLFRRIQVVFSLYGWYKRVQPNQNVVAPRLVSWYHDTSLLTLVAASIAYMILDVSPSRMIRALVTDSPIYRQLHKIIGLWDNPDQIVYDLAETHHIPARTGTLTHVLLCATLVNLPHFITRTDLYEFWQELDRLPNLRARHGPLFDWWEAKVFEMDQGKKSNGLQGDPWGFCPDSQTKIVCEDSVDDDVDSWCTLDEIEKDVPWIVYGGSEAFVCLTDTNMPNFKSSVYHAMVLLAVDPEMPSIFGRTLLRCIFLHTALPSTRRNQSQFGVFTTDMPMKQAEENEHDAANPANTFIKPEDNLTLLNVTLHCLDRIRKLDKYAYPWPLFDVVAESAQPVQPIPTFDPWIWVEEAPPQPMVTVLPLYSMLNQPTPAEHMALVRSFNNVITHNRKKHLLSPCSEHQLYRVGNLKRTYSFDKFSVS